jgi:predicted RNA binding protein YcfA (HicA-like mRNA interferase family)
MSALPLVHGHTSKEALKALAKAGWQTVGQVGSHLVMTKSGQRANLSIPQHKELSVRHTALAHSKRRHQRGRLPETALTTMTLLIGATQLPDQPLQFHLQLRIQVRK